MNKSLLLVLLALVFALGLSKNSEAECFNTGVTFDGGNVINCSLPVQTSPVGLALNPPFANTTVMTEEVTVDVGAGIIVNGLASGAMNLSGGPDVVTTSGNFISDFGVGLGTSSGGDTVFMNGGIIRCTDPVANGFLPAGVFMGGANDLFQLNDGLIESTTAFPAINTHQNNDIIECNGGTITGAVVAIEMFSGNDTLIVDGCTINGEIQMGTTDDLVTLYSGTLNVPFLRMEQGIDTVNIAGDVDTGGVILGGGGGGIGDTLIFSMNVPIDQVGPLTAQINASNPADDNITINGIQYVWTTFENLVANLNGVVSTMTLSPIGAVNPLDTDHTVTATISSSVGPPADVIVTFEVDSGPNSGIDSGSEGTCSPNPDCSTDANGQVSWTYTGTLEAGVGTDTIVATVDDQFIGMITSNSVEKEWVFPLRDVPTLSEWGLIAMAGLLGIVGFMVMRRRKVAV